jgi:DNA-binding GntR family transcriptional regulator
MASDRYRLNSTLSRRVTAVELVRDALRTAILRGDLPGDSRLVQTEIASELGVSTTPVREAMRELASDGLITLDSHRIGIVRKPDWDEMLEIVEMRHALERLVIQRAIVNITGDELAQAHDLAEALAEEDVDLGTWVQLNIQFHCLFHNASKSVRIAPVAVSLENAAGVFVAQAQRLHPEIRQRGIRDHFMLIEAYKEKDLERAIEIEHGHTTLPLQAAALENGGVMPTAAS